VIRLGGPAAAEPVPRSERVGHPVGHVGGGAMIARPSSWCECRLIQEGESIGLTATQCPSASTGLTG
jgi:hypothetical protein